MSRGLTPTFFLGELLEERRVGELTILILGPELARDLDASPALCQGTLIYARRQALAFYLWDHLADPTQQGNAYLQLALKAYNLTLKDLLSDPEAHQEQFNAFLAGELEAVIRHEMGEALEPSLQDAFPAVLERFPQTRLELWVRTLKDALADVNDWGRLAYIVAEAAPAVPGGDAGLAPGAHPGAACRSWRRPFRTCWPPATGASWTRPGAQALTRLREMAAGLNTLLEAPEAASPAWLQDELHRRYLAPLGL